MKSWSVGVIGATGMVGQRFVQLLSRHPWFRLRVLAASSRSAGKPYGQVMEGRWLLPEPLPEEAASLPLYDAVKEAHAIARMVDFVFCAVDLPRGQCIALEERYARMDCPVISNNSACRLLPDVPMILPECNPQHAAIIEAQRRRLGCRRGFIAVKPNCSLQSFVPAVQALWELQPQEVQVVSCQALSGAGKTPESWPEMADNVLPYIPGEEEKTTVEPLKIWGKVEKGRILPAQSPSIRAQCLRVPVSDGHMAAVFLKLGRDSSREEILQKWRDFPALSLPSAPKQPIHVLEEPDRPQTRLDRMREGGMALSVGRLRQDSPRDFRFVCLSHNTLRGAAGGAVLLAELLAQEGYL